MVAESKYLNKLKNNKKLIFDLSVLISGTTISQGIPLILQPLLRRLFSPEEFGVFAIYSSIFGIVSIAASLRYEQAILIPRAVNEARSLYSLSFILAMITSVMIGIALLLCFIFIPDFLSVPASMRPFYMFLPLSGFCFAAYQGLNSLMLREEMFRNTSYSRIIRRTSEGIIQISIGKIIRQGGLILGDFVGNLFFFISGLYFLLKKKLNPFYFDKINLWHVAKKYIDFPRINLIPHMLSIVSIYIPFFIINKRFESNIVGQFDLANMVLTIPTALISTTLSQLIFQRIASARKYQSGFIRDIRFIIMLLGSVSVITIIIIVLFASPLFTFIFGRNWQMAGTIARIIVFSSMIRFVVSPFSVIFLALEKIPVNSYWQLSHFILLISILLLRADDLKILLFRYVAVELTSYSIYFIFIWKEVKRYHKSIGSS